MALEEQDIEYLCDILFADREKLSSCLGQIEPSGVITGYKTSATDSQSNKSGMRGTIKVISGDMATTETVQEMAERTFDPASALPITVMDRMDELGFIHRDFSSVSIGSIVLLKGSLRLRDLSQSITMWPIISKLIPFSQFRDMFNAKPKESGSKITVDDIKDCFKNLFIGMPRPLQMTLSCEGKEFWASLQESGFVGSSSDLFLKHRKYIPGEWYVLGILDCYPTSTEPVREMSGDHTTDFCEAMHDATSGIRALFGRPDTAFGVSPLMVFRKVKKIAD